MKFGKNARQSTHVEEVPRLTPKPSRLQEMMDWMTGQDVIDEYEGWKKEQETSTPLGRLRSGNIKGRHRMRDDQTYLSKTQKAIKASDTELGKLGRHADAVREDVALSYIEKRRINQEYKKKNDPRYKPYGPGGEYEGM